MKVLATACIRESKGLLWRPMYKAILVHMALGLPQGCTHKKLEAYQKRITQKFATMIVKCHEMEFPQS